MEGPGATGGRRPDTQGLVDRLEVLARRAQDSGGRTESREVADEHQDRDRDRAHDTLLLVQTEHRINTTLALIEGWARTLERHWDAMPADTRKNGLATIQRRALDVRHEVEVLLTITGAKAGTAESSVGAEPESPRVDVSLVLGQTVGNYRGGSRRGRPHSSGGPAPGPGRGGDAAVEVSFVGRSPLYARVDVASLSRACSLLVDHSVRLLPGGGEVTVCATARDGSLVVEVVNPSTGMQGDGRRQPGAPLDTGVVDLAKRESWTSAGAHPRAQPGAHPAGSDVGLRSVRALVRSMGGEVGYHANERRGSTFEIVLPLDRPPGIPFAK